MTAITKEQLIAFESAVAAAFEAKQIRGPVHLSGANEDQLIEIFERIDREDWVFSTYRSHYHALLHGIDREWLMAEILAGRSMNIMSPEHRFFTSAIVSGCLPIAVGVAAALKRQGSERKVFCFVGDMAASTGAFYEATSYACMQDLPIHFLIEDNKMSCNTPTNESWGNAFHGWHEGSIASMLSDKTERYHYERVYPHVGVSAWIKF